jgi:UPF0755 protein
VRAAHIVIFNKKKLFIVVILLVLAVATMMEIQRQWQLFLISPIADLSQPQIIEIKKGSSLRSVVNQLYVGSASNPFNWQWRVVHKFRPQWTQIKAGTFKIDFPATPEQFVNQLQNKQEIQSSFTIVEGLNRYQLLQQINKSVNPPLSLLDLNDLVGSEYIHAEGLFLADTYFYNTRQTVVDVLKQAHQKLLLLLEQEWQNRQDNLPYNQAYDALIMASIIEKETAIKSEYGLISSVFTNRLRLGMRLQMDSTVIYGVWDQYQGDITRQHLKTTTPYNTYRINGLPPTPIAMISKASINATLHPMQTNYLYFVADGKGGHTFSETLEQHNRAVKEMLRRQND